MNDASEARPDLGPVLERRLRPLQVRVDELEDQIIAELLNAARHDISKLDCAIALIDVAHTLERLADRTTNIAERVIFITTNVTEQLNA